MSKQTAAPAQITVRAISRVDFAQWEILWERYNRFYQRVIPTEVTQMTWSRFFDSYEPVYALVAERDSKLVGLAHYLFHRNTAMLGPTCYLNDLFTDEAARRGGVGRALIQAVYENARNAGAARIYWHTHETNRTARALYDAVAERSGFLVYARSL